MSNKGYVNEFMSVGRVVSHGKITDLTQGFSLPHKVPFSVYIRPKAEVSDVDVLLNVKCFQDNGFSDVPIGFNDWCPLAIIEIAPNESILEQNDIYWGGGADVGI